jgi:hypothetical protein
VAAQHLPPWQPPPQHCAADVHAFAMGKQAHWPPLVHMPLQQSPGPLHEPPAPPQQAPPMQRSEEQHSAFERHDWPLRLQQAPVPPPGGVLQWRPAQQSPSLVQTGALPMVQQRPPLHERLQQSSLVVHEEPVGRQQPTPPGGEQTRGEQQSSLVLQREPLVEAQVQAPPVQVSPQQSYCEPQAAPTGLQQEPMPLRSMVQARLAQHCDGSVQ